MSQSIFNDIVPSVTSGNSLANLLNDFKDAVASGFIGTSRPSNLQAGGYWIDSTNDPTSWDYNIYDGSSDITIFTINLTTGVATITNADTLFEISKVSDDAVGPILRLLKERIAGGGQVLVGDSVGEIHFYGTRDTGVNTIQSRIASISLDNVTASVQGAYIVFEATVTGASSKSEMMRLIDSKLGIGTTAPSRTLHVKGTGVKGEKDSDDIVGSILELKKKRTAGTGAVQSGDVIAEIDATSYSSSSADVNAAKILISATEGHTSSAQGSKIEFQNKKATTNSFVTLVKIQEDVNIIDPVVDATGALYFGPRLTDGSWRYIQSGSNLLLQNRVSGSWVTKDTINP